MQADIWAACLRLTLWKLHARVHEPQAALLPTMYRHRWVSSDMFERTTPKCNLFQRMEEWLSSTRTCKGSSGEDQQAHMYKG